MRIAISFVFMLFVHWLFAQDMRIGVLATSKLASVQVAVGHGTFDLQIDSTKVGTLEKGASIDVKAVGGESIFTYYDKSYSGKKITLYANEKNAFFTIKGLSPLTKIHSYHGSLQLSVVKSKLQAVNTVSMDDYLAGVIESEGGGGQHLEYYKVQAVMSRSYALKNSTRHQKDGYQLCDDVHCQAYHNRCRTEMKIKDAVSATRGEVIVDGKGNIITTYFYANCGGQTSQASYVWNTDVSYCEPFLDTFCIHTRQANWETRISRSKWESFIKKEYGINLADSALSFYAYNFKQEQRKAFYIHPSLGIPLRDLRSEFGLKSTFFDVSLQGEEVLLKGKGFGHGVGLCQEGAMQMAKLGYHYSQIALFYFTGVKLKRFGSSDSDILK